MDFFGDSVKYCNTIAEKVRLFDVRVFPDGCLCTYYTEPLDSNPSRMRPFVTHVGGKQVKISLRHHEGTKVKQRYSPTHTQPRRWKGVGGQRHDPAA